MRLFAGIICLMFGGLALAQARGQVESVGFGGAYRPGCWTPMVVHLVPTTGGNFSGRIEVVQEDLDRDTVIFTRQIQLTGNPANGPTAEARFWMYFIPQPAKDDKYSLDATKTRDELTKLISVRLTKEDGKLLASLPITQTLRPVDSLQGGTMGSAGVRGRKLLLAVYERSSPNLGDFKDMVGINEDIEVEAVTQIATGLPDSVIGYDGVDGIVWTDGDPSTLSSEQLTALEDYVKRGGKLILSQDTAPNQWQRNGVRFPIMMPVTVKGVETRDDKLATLRSMARVPIKSADWDRLKGPFKYAAADVKPGAVVSKWQVDEKNEPLMDEAGKPKPYIVRQAFGSGCVTWVAQDLGEKQITGDRFTTGGWVHVWDEVLDLPNEPVSAASQQTVNGTSVLLPDLYKANVTTEFGRGYLRHLNLDSTSAALIGIAVLFFIVYWVAAGPGSYLVLSKKGKSSLSWFIFAAIAIGATGLTVGIVKLVLRGAPQLKHVTWVRSSPGEPAQVHSEFGLYVPRDGAQKIELKDAAANRASYVTALNLHPAFNDSEIDFPARQEYRVPVKELHLQDRPPEDPKVIEVPYRSTLKRFQAQWVGALPGGIEGSVKLSKDVPLVTGNLTNKTGHDLRRVYLVLHHPGIETDLGQGRFVNEEKDLALFISFWPDGGSVNLDAQFKPFAAGGAPAISEGKSLEDSASATKQIYFRGEIGDDSRSKVNSWTEYWLASWRSSNNIDRVFEESDPLTPVSFPILSFYDRIHVSRNVVNKDKAADRVDFLRRGLRRVDMSASISAGQMAIIGVDTNKEDKLPFPLEVQGDKIEGKGVVYYQFTVPVDRSGLKLEPVAATTKPTTQKGR